MAGRHMDRRRSRYNRGIGNLHPFDDLKRCGATASAPRTPPAPSAFPEQHCSAETDGGRRGVFKPTKTGLGSRADGLERQNRSLARFHCAHRFRRFIGDLLHPRALFPRLHPRPAAASKSTGVCDDRNTLRIRRAVLNCECHRRARHRPDLHPTRFVNRFFRTFAPRPGTRPTAASPRSSKFKTTRVLPLPSALNTASARPGRLAWNGSARAARGSGRPGCAIARNFRLERDMSDPRPP